jgi:hypothetical protein
MTTKTTGAGRLCPICSAQLEGGENKTVCWNCRAQFGANSGSAPPSHPLDATSPASTSSTDFSSKFLDIIRALIVMALVFGTILLVIVGSAVPGNTRWVLYFCAAILVAVGYLILTTNSGWPMWFGVLALSIPAALVLFILAFLSAAISSR